ncbi:hypothetical protein, partial [Acinetobacter sp. AGC35]
MKKPFLLLSSIMVALTFTLAGCGSSNDNSKNTAGTGNKDNQSTSPKKNVTLDFMLNSADDVLAAFKDIAKKYEGENPGVK